MNAQFFTLDGIDGAGKSTNLAVMRAWFEQHHLPVLFTREPGGTPIGEALRDLLLNPATQASVRTETLIMFAARQQHLDDVIQPALASGTHVVSDRFTDATFAYQGGGRSLPLADIAALEHWVQQDFRPDLTLLLDVPPAVSAARLDKHTGKDRFEREAADFFARTRQVYLDRAAREPERYALIDSSKPADTVARDIQVTLNRHFGFSA